MGKKFSVFFLTIILFFSLQQAGNAGENFRLRIFFGLSRPDGGAVSLEQWQAFQDKEITRFFDGFNVVDSVGYYKGKAERSKIVTVIVGEDGIGKAEKLAKLYAVRFSQDSVMIVKVPVSECSFITAD
jgi:hypothetical protein